MTRPWSCSPIVPSLSSRYSLDTNLFRYEANIACQESTMESNRFDTVTRSLSSRRATLTSLLGGVAALLGVAGVEEAGAHNPIPNCRRVADPKKRRACLRRARAHIRQRHTCRPQP